MFCLRVPDIHDLLGVRNRAMLEVLYSTGIRRIEIARLELRDVHRERQTLYVMGKGGKDRVVPLGRPIECPVPSNAPASCAPNQREWKRMTRE